MDVTDREPFDGAGALDRLVAALLVSLDDLQVASAVSAHLAVATGGRAAVLVRRDGRLVVIGSAGFVPDSAVGRSVTPIDATEIDRDGIDGDRTHLTAPLRADGSGGEAGVVYVGWPQVRDIDDATRISVSTVASLASLALARIAVTEQGHQDRFRQALDAMLDEVTIGSAVRGDDGSIVDFRVDFVNSRTADGSRRDPAAFVGRRLGDVDPVWRTSGLLDRLRDVVDSGTPSRVDRLRVAHDPTAGADRDRFWSVQISSLGDGYIAASRDVTEQVEGEQAALAALLRSDNERTAIELLQSAALPNALPAMPGIGIAAVYEPADPMQPVGGDWYDVFELDARRVALVIADVAGHGREAAIFMVQVRNVFRALAIEHGEPDEVLALANAATSRLKEPGGPFVTCCYAVLDAATRTLHWAQAGHFSPMVVGADGTATYLTERSGPPLALGPAQAYERSAATLRSGDRVLMFTDGMVERRREHLDVGIARLGATAQQHRGLPVADFVGALAGSVTDRFDDLALLCVDLI